MNTKQVEEKTGISRQNIRFYEKMGLLHPARKEGNAYRDYSEEDLSTLEYIKLFRMLSIPIEEISRIFSGEISVPDALKLQREHLTEKQKEMQGAIRICEQMEKECSSGNTIAAAEYLNRIEYEQHTKGGFGGFREDYQKLVASEGIRQYSFLTDEEVQTTENLTEVVRDSMGEDWEITEEKDQCLATHGELTYQISRKQMRQGGKHSRISTLVILTLKDSREVAMPEKRRHLMYTLHSVGKNMKTHKWRSVLSVMFSLFIILLLAAYTGSVRNIEKQQDILPKRTTIQGTVYNQNGTLEDGLLIQEQYVDGIASSPYITKIMEKASLAAVLANEPDNQHTLNGMNEALLQDKMTGVDVEWNEFYNFKKFDQSFGICMVNQNFAKTQGLEIGDSISVDNYYFFLDPQLLELVQLPLNSVSMEIVGTYQITNESKDGVLPDIIVPLSEVKNWYSDEGMRYYASAVSFYVKNPKELNALKKELKEMGFNEIKTELGTDYSGSTVALNDQEFIETSDRLARSQNLLQSFWLLILVLVILIGVVVAYLITQSRRNEVTIMRMLGVGRKNIVSSYTMEQMSLFLMGMLAAIVVIHVFAIPGSLLLLQMILLFMASYLAGVMIAVGQMIPSRNVRMDHTS
ncbi:MAG: MerR family transcriptional regulator [Hespellia sp.]|nr:MerR family transcriptional regulator [Hespellia sp.]